MPSSLGSVQVCHGLSSGAYTKRAGLHVCHLENGFASSLPRGYVLDGKQKICLCLYPAQPNVNGADRVIDGMRYGTIGGVSLLSFGPFDFKLYKDSNASTRDEIVLGRMENAFAAVAREFGSDEKPIHQAAAAIRASSYELESETGLSRSTKNRRVRVHVFVRFQRAGLTWRAEVRTRTGEILAEQCLLKRGSYFDIEADFFKSSLEGQTFALFDWKGRRRATVDLRPYAAYKTLERAEEHRGRIVLARDCVLADAQRRSWPAAQLNR